MTTRKATEQEMKDAQRLVHGLRKVRDDVVDAVEQFDKYLTMTSGVANDECRAHQLADPRVATRGLEMIESITHIHTGSTAHMNYRHVRDDLIEFAANGKFSL